MKLSDIEGDRVFDVIADLVEPIAAIAQDEEAKALFERKPCPKGEDPRDFMARRLKAGIPKLMRAHKAELVTILAAIKGVDADAYREGLNLAVLVSDLAELMNDDEFMAFLSSPESTGE